MEQLQTEIMAILIPAVTTAIGIVLTWGLAELKRFIASRTKNENIRHALESVGELTFHTVAELNQSVRKAYEDGKLTPDEAKKLKAEALAKIKIQIPEAMKIMLEAAVTNLDDYLGTLVESNVAAQKPRLVAESEGRMGSE